MEAESMQYSYTSNNYFYDEQSQEFFKYFIILQHELIET